MLHTHRRKELILLGYSLALDAFAQPMNPVRKPCEHYMIAKGHANDDEVNA